MSEATKTLAELFIDALRANALELHTSMPAKIKTYDATLQKADVEPLLKKKYKFNDTPVNLPVITNVPVQWESANGGNAFIHLPLKQGDTGWLVFSERSIDIWLSGNGEAVYPNDPRHHDLSDAIFIPGVRPFKAALTIDNPDNLIVKNNSMTIEMDPSGKIKIEGSSQELLTVIDNFMTNVINATVLVSSGSSAGTWPLSPATIANLTIDQTNLQTLKI